MIKFSSFRSHCSPSSGDGATGRGCLRAANQKDHISFAATAAGALSERAVGDEVSGHGEKKQNCSRSCACTPRLDRISKASASANVSDLTVNGSPTTPSCQNAYRGRVAPGTGLGEKKKSQVPARQRVGGGYALRAFPCSVAVSRRCGEMNVTAVTHRTRK
jgi:hypothetical protein